eukprot:UN03720
MQMCPKKRICPVEKLNADIFYLMIDNLTFKEMWQCARLNKSWKKAIEDCYYDGWVWSGKLLNLPIHNKDYMKRLCDSFSSFSISSVALTFSWQRVMFNTCVELKDLSIHYNSHINFGFFSKLLR